jgi:hypothetical protein
VPKSYESIEMIRQKRTMANEIAGKIDPEFGFYAGAEITGAYQMAMIDTIIKNGLVTGDMVVLLKLRRAFLNQERKAFFGATSDVLTKLGLISGSHLGEPRHANWRKEHR